jgi:hypothetical protein
MDSELLNKVVSEPEHWLFYLCLAGAIMFALKIINVAADAFVKRLSAKVKEKKGLLTVLGAGGKVVAIALVIYIANAIYWSQVIKQFTPPASDKPINTCDATVELVIESQDNQNTHFMSSGGYLAFGKGTEAVLVTAAPDSWGRSVASNEYLFRGEFKMDASSSAAGKPVNILQDAEYVQVEFLESPKEFNLIRGKAVCILNSEVRIPLEFADQKVTDKKVYLRDMKVVKEILK